MRHIQYIFLHFSYNMHHHILHFCLHIWYTFLHFPTLFLHFVYAVVNALGLHCVSTLLNMPTFSVLIVSTAIGLWKHRIPSDLRS